MMEQINMLLKKTTSNINKNGFKPFLRQSHFVVTFCGGIINLDNYGKIRGFRFPVYRKRTHFIYNKQP